MVGFTYTIAVPFMDELLEFDAYTSSVTRLTPKPSPAGEGGPLAVDE